MKPVNNQSTIDETQNIVLNGLLPESVLNQLYSQIDAAVLERVGPIQRTCIKDMGEFIEENGID